MKSVITSIQPYYVFLIIARLMGWDIPQEKTVEVRKDYPKDSEWNKVTHIYCSKNRRSFNRIPKQYQPFMKKLLGKVVGEFVCDTIVKYEGGIDYGVDDNDHIFYCGTLAECTGLTRTECLDYGKKKIRLGWLLQDLYGWHISDLKIYDTPKELGEFYHKLSEKVLENGDYDCRKGETICMDYPEGGDLCEDCPFGGRVYLTRPPQSWCYVEA